MKLLRDHEVPMPPEVREHRETDWTGLAVGVLTAPLVPAAWAAPWLIEGGARWWLVLLAIVWGLIIALFPYFGLRGFFASRRPEAWRLRWSPAGLYLRFRSHHNWRFPGDTPTTIHLPRREVAWLRLRTASLDRPDEVGQWRAQRLKTRALEIGLKNLDPAPIAEALTAERQRRHKGGRVKDEPLRLTAAGSLTLHLRRARRRLDQLRTYYPAGLDEHREGKAFADMSRAEREDHVLALAATGDTIAAIKAARELYGCDLTEAKRLVEEMTGEL